MLRWTILGVYASSNYSREVLSKNPEEVHELLVRVPEILARILLPEHCLQFPAFRAVQPQETANADRQLRLGQFGFGSLTGNICDSAAAGVGERLRRIDGYWGSGLRIRHWDAISAACGAHFLVRLALILYLCEDSVVRFDCQPVGDFVPLNLFFDSIFFNVD